MPQSVPVWVQAAIASYDSSLRLRWSPLGSTYVLERKMRNTPVDKTDRLMGILNRRLGRLRGHERTLISELRDRTVVDQEVQTAIRKALPAVIQGRMEAGLKLESLTHNHVLIFQVPEPTANEPWTDRLMCIIFTIQHDDVWRAGGFEKFYQEMLEEDRREHAKRKERLRRVMREGAAEAHADIARADGRRILVNKSRRLRRRRRA